MKWVKSSKCNVEHCVEVSTDAQGNALMRDSKDPEGPVLSFTSETWAEFTGRVKAGHID